MEGSAGRKATDRSGEETDRILLVRLRFDPRAWPRTRADDERVALFASLYEEQGLDALPPIGVVRRGDELLLYDGVHRVGGAKAAGLSELRAAFLDVSVGEDPVLVAFLHAVEASTGGHKELSRSERQAGIRRLIAETDLGDADIAGLFGVSRQTVWRIRNPRVADVTPSSDGPEDAGERYYAESTAQQAAVRFLRGMEKVYQARGLGLWDALTRDHSADRLARVLRDTYGADALDRAQRFGAWIEGAIEILEGRDR